MVLDAEMINAKQHFKTNNINLSDCWLENCVEWFRENNANYTQKEMVMKIYDQWLLLDLRQVDVPTLPSNIKSIQKTVLPGIYALQIEKIVDISKPKLVQLQQIRKSAALEHADNRQESLGQKRMLQLTLTDGTQDVIAFEYNIVKCLHKNLMPGIKIQITGPVNVRRGQILLTDKCVKLLGGEVEELSIKNAQENVLAAALNLPTNPNPIVCPDEMPGVQEVDEETSRGSNLKRKTEKPGRNLDQLPLPDNSPRKVITPICADDRTKQQRTAKTPDLFDDMDVGDEIFENFNVSVAVKKEETVKLETVEDKDNIFAGSFCDVVDEKFFEEINIFEPKSELITIEELQNKYLPLGVYKIKAKFKSIVEKLTVSNSFWYMKMTVEDESGYLEVLMHNDLITDLIGYSAADMLKCKVNVINKDQETIDKILKAIGNLRNKIFSIDCVMSVEFTESTPIPVIIKLFHT